MLKCLRRIFKKGIYIIEIIVEKKGLSSPSLQIMKYRRDYSTKTKRSIGEGVGFQNAEEEFSKSLSYLNAHKPK